MFNLALSASFLDSLFEPVYQWFANRTFDSGHLIGGPTVGCFRFEDKVKIVDTLSATTKANQNWAEGKRKKNDLSYCVSYLACIGCSFQLNFAVKSDLTLLGVSIRRVFYL